MLRYRLIFFLHGKRYSDTLALDSEEDAKEAKARVENGSHTALCVGTRTDGLHESEFEDGALSAKAIGRMTSFCSQRFHMLNEFPTTTVITIKPVKNPTIPKLKPHAEILNLLGCQ